MLKQVIGAAAVAAALAAAPAGAMAAAYGPACTANIAAAEVGATGGCYFDSPTDYAQINTTTDGTVTATVRCVTTYGTVRETSRTYYGPGRFSWSPHTPGSCRLTLTSAFSGTTANATATPTVGPIFEPYPVS